MTPLLAIDVGNTNTVLGLIEGDDVIEHWRLSTDAKRTADEWWLQVRGLLELSGRTSAQIGDVAIGSVVPKVTQALLRMFERAKVQPLVVSWKTPAGMTIDLAEPSELGADRLANAVAAHHAYPDEAVIVVDMGTATTLDVVSAQGSYLGGVILPGVDISLEALFDRAAALRRVDLVAPPAVVGNSTARAVQSGATYGYVSQVDGLCARVIEEIGDARVIATGGLAASISSLSRQIDSYDPWLTLRGLKLVYEASGG